MCSVFGSSCGRCVRYVTNAGGRPAKPVAVDRGSGGSSFERSMETIKQEVLDGGYAQSVIDMYALSAKRRHHVMFSTGRVVAHWSVAASRALAFRFSSSLSLFLHLYCLIISFLRSSLHLSISPSIHPFNRSVFALWDQTTWQRERALVAVFVVCMCFADMGNEAA